jgi:hypothetical protein
LTVRSNPIRFVLIVAGGSAERKNHAKWRDRFGGGLDGTIGKRGVCFVDPDLALETRRATLLTHHPDATPLLRKSG